MSMSPPALLAPAARRMLLPVVRGAYAVPLVVLYPVMMVWFLTVGLLGFLAVALPFCLISFGELEVPSGLTAVLLAPASIFVALFAPFLEAHGHRLVVTSDKDGPDSEFERELPEADVVISQPFRHPLATAPSR